MLIGQSIQELWLILCLTIQKTGRGYSGAGLYWAYMNRTLQAESNGVVPKLVGLSMEEI